MVQRQIGGRAEEVCAGDAEARLGRGAVRAHGTVHRADRLSVEHLRAADLPDRLPLECREEIAPS